MGILRGGTAAAAALAVAAVLASAACGGGDSAGPASDNLIRLYGSDGNMLNSVGAAFKEHPGALAGMKGTAPLTELSESFKQRLRAIDPKLTDYLYSGESYDAVVISALAAETAGSTEPRELAKQINGVTTGGTECDRIATCMALVRQGRDIAYRGMSLRLSGFTDAGEPAAGSYGILRFNSQNQLDDAQTEYVPTGDVSAATTKKPPVPDRDNGSMDALKVGSLLPRTGSLAVAGPPMFAGTRLAIKELNDAGGVLGKQVQYSEGDDGTDSAVAKATLARLINEGAQVIIGAGASSITQAVLPQVVAAGRVLFSPCNTAATLSTANDNGLYFRTAPPDGLQATALSDIIMRDGVRRIVIVARNDAYVDRPTPPKGPPWAHNSLGASVHTALRAWFDLPRDRRRPAALGTLLRATWVRDGYRDDEQERTGYRRALAWLESYVESLDPEFEPLAVERTVAAKTATLALSGRVDRIDAVDGDLVIVDYKTGRTGLDRDDARGSRALALYAYAAARTFRRPSRRVELHHLPTGTVAAHEHSDEALARHVRRAEETAADAVAAERAVADGADPDEAFPPRPGSICGWCDFRGACPAAVGIAAREPWAGLLP